MRVAVLWLGNVSGDTAGRTYLTELLGPLGRLPGLDVDVHLADSEFAVPESCRAFRHALPLPPGPAARIAAEPLVAASLARRGYDVLLAPFNFLPPGWRGPSVVVEHNVLGFSAPVRLPGRFSRLRAVYRPRATRWSLRHATRTIAVSSYLRRLLLERFSFLEPEHVHVAPYGVSRQLLESAAGARVSDSRPDVLVVSALWPYKRVDQAIRVFAAAT